MNSPSLNSAGSPPDTNRFPSHVYSILKSSGFFPKGAGRGLRWGLVFLVLAGFFSISGSIASAQNQSVGSGDWFNDLIWRNLRGQQLHPESGDQERRVHISGGSQVQISDGDAAVDLLLFIGDGNGGLAGDGTLLLTGGTLSAGSIFVAGDDDQESRAILDIRSGATVRAGEIRIGNTFGTTGDLLMQGGTIETDVLLLGLSSGTGRGTISGGTINTGLDGGTTGLIIGLAGKGVLDMTAGKINALQESGVDFGRQNGHAVVNLRGSAEIDSEGDISMGSFGSEVQFSISENAVFHSDKDILIRNSGGAGSQYLIDGGLVRALGNFQVNGQNTVQMRGGLLQANRLIVSEGIAGSTMNISGGRVNVTDSVRVGEDGLSSGVLNLQGNSVTNADQMQIGVFASSKGRVNVFGNTQVNLANRLVVGSNANEDDPNDNAKGFLHIQNGIVNVGRDTFIGVSGDGEVHLTGGKLITGRTLFLGRNASGTGLLRMTGGELETQLQGDADPIRGDLNVGHLGQGQMELSGDARVKVANDMTVGLFSSSSGLLTMNGQSRVEVADIFNVGSSGGDGLVQLGANALLSARLVDVGLSDGDAELNMDGQSIVRTTTSDFRVGVTGIGRVTITGEAQIDAGDDLLIGVFDDGKGVLDAEGGKIITNDDLTVGSSGDGTFNVMGQSEVQLGGNLVVADRTGSVGNVHLDDDAQVFVSDLLRASVRSNTDSTLTLDGSSRLKIGDSGFFGIGGSSTSRVLIGASSTLGQNPTLEATDLLNFGTSASGSRKVDFQLHNGLVRARSIRFSNDPFDKSEVVSNILITGGRMKVADSISFRGGSKMVISGGVIESEDEILFAGSELSLGQTSVLHQGGNLIAGGDLIMARNAFSEVQYTMNSGTITVGSNLQMGDPGSGSIDPFSGEELPPQGFFFQNGGTVSVAGNINNTGEFFHEVHGGLLDVSGSMNVGVDDFLSFGNFNQTGGQVLVGNRLAINNAAVNLEGDAQFTASQVNVADFSDAEGILEINGGVATFTQLFVGRSDAGHFSATVRQRGGTLNVGQRFVNDRGGEYQFTGGTLTSHNAGQFEYLGDLKVTDQATLKLDDDKTLLISGQFLSEDADEANLFIGGGVLDLSDLILPESLDEDGFISLIQVGDNTNLLSKTALDQIRIIGLDPGARQRVTESGFGSDQGEAIFALVEGTDFGRAFEIGIAFKTVTAVPEPGSGIVLGLLCSAGLLCRRRR